jgi:hypothetical protein
MRRAEGQAAEVAAREAAVEAAAGVAQAISPAFEGLKASIGNLSPNPMASMFANAMQPFLQQAMGQVMGIFTKSIPRQQGEMQPIGAQPGIQSGQPNVQSPSQPSVSKEASEEEVKAAFDD